jgi:hypothetical protein
LTFGFLGRAGMITVFVVAGEISKVGIEFDFSLAVLECS